MHRSRSLIPCISVPSTARIDHLVRDNHKITRGCFLTGPRCAQQETAVRRLGVFACVQALWRWEQGVFISAVSGASKSALCGVRR